MAHSSPPSPLSRGFVVVVLVGRVVVGRVVVVVVAGMVVVVVVVVVVVAAMVVVVALSDVASNVVVVLPSSSVGMVTGLPSALGEMSPEDSPLSPLPSELGIPWAATAGRIPGALGALEGLDGLSWAMTGRDGGTTCASPAGSDRPRLAAGG